MCRMFSRVSDRVDVLRLHPWNEEALCLFVSCDMVSLSWPVLEKENVKEIITLHIVVECTHGQR